MKNIILIFIASVLLAVSLNIFLLPHKILIGGVTGTSMILGILTPFNTGIINFVLNIPIFVLGFLKIGKRFMFYSVFSVLVTSLTLQFLPIVAVSSDIILSTVFGGVISGIAIGIIIRCGGSTGGLDIISLVLAKTRDFPLGEMMFGLNAIVVVFAGFIFSWELALYTLLSIFVTSKVIDNIHTQHIKLTLMIITSKGEEVKEELLGKLYRGITVLDGEGAYTKESRKVLFTVISRYELMEVKEIIKSIDDKAFVNITETVEVVGTFNKR